MFHAAHAKLRHWRHLIKVACVVAVAMASIMHLVADFRSVQTDTLSVAAAKSDTDRSAADRTTEACHSCAVVALFAATQNLEVTSIAEAIPAGRALHMFTFRQPLKAPPPRALT